MYSQVLTNRGEYSRFAILISRGQSVRFLDILFFHCRPLGPGSDYLQRDVVRVPSKDGQRADSRLAKLPKNLFRGGRTNERGRYYERVPAFALRSRMITTRTSPTTTARRNILTNVYERLVIINWWFGRPSSASGINLTQTKNSRITPLQKKKNGKRLPKSVRVARRVADVFILRRKKTYSSTSFITREITRYLVTMPRLVSLLKLPTLSVKSLLISIRAYIPHT